MSDGVEERSRLGKRSVFGDRTFRFDVPVGLLFAALTVDEARWWLRLQPGEVEPQVLEAVPFVRVVWSSFWPVSPDDTIEFDLSEDETRGRLPSTGTRLNESPSKLRWRWFSDFPPDERGVAITRHRLNRKIGGDLQAVESEFSWRGSNDTTQIVVDGHPITVPMVTGHRW